MSKHVDHSRKVAAAILGVICMLSAAGCLESASSDHEHDDDSSTGGQSSRTATGGASASGGSAMSSGGDSTTSSGGAGGETRGEGGSGGTTVGRTGSGGAGGGSERGQPDAQPADVLAGVGGHIGSETGSGGNAPDASPDVAVPRDLGTPDRVPVPDLPVRTDTPPAFWSSGLAANCAPGSIGGRAQTDGHHRAGENCMTSGCHANPKKPEHHAGTDCRGSGCHSNGSPDGSGAPAFLFGGTAYRAVTLAADPGVEIGVRTTQGFYSACSATNGNFWYVAPSGTTALAWTGATTRLRNANGEAPMMTTPAAGCNATACHTGTMKMTSP